MEKIRPKRDIQAIIRRANSYVNADTSDFPGLKRYLTAWYCFTFKTTFKDPVFLSHSFEELLLLYFMFSIKDRPEDYRYITAKEELESYEEFIKKQMGEDYISQEEMVAQMEVFDQKEKRIADTLPDVITTDFLNPDNEVNE